MNLKKEIIFRIAEGIFGLIAFTITDHLLETHKYTTILSIGIGILVPILIEAFRTPFKIDNLESNLSSKVDNLEFIYKKLIDHIEEKRIELGDIKLIFKYCNLKITKKEMPKIWASLLANVTGSYKATNYISANKIYKGDTSWSEVAWSLQKIKLQHEKLPITKVFIVSDKEDLKTFASIEKEQSGEGINMKFIYKEKLDNELLLKDYKTNLASFDFGLFNNDKILLIWDIDESSRDFTGGSLIFDKNEIEKYTDFFNNLINASETYNKLLEKK